MNTAVPDPYYYLAPGGGKYAVLHEITTDGEGRTFARTYVVIDRQAVPSHSQGPVPFKVKEPSKLSTFTRKQLREQLEIVVLDELSDINNRDLLQYCMDELTALQDRIAAQLPSGRIVHDLTTLGTDTKSGVSLEASLASLITSVIGKSTIAHLNREASTRATDVTTPPAEPDDPKDGH